MQTPGCGLFSSAVLSIALVGGAQSTGMALWWTRVVQAAAAGLRQQSRSYSSGDTRPATWVFLGPPVSHG